MRIALINWTRRRVGGVETYLNSIIPELLQYGHSVSFMYEIDEPANREQINLSNDSPSWCVSTLGLEQALAELRDWRPDLIYTHLLLGDPELEVKTLELAPAVLFGHTYYPGMCISGTKTFRNPTITPCTRRFGWQCLLHYYPHRCGGLSPVTMLKLYSHQSKRYKLLSKYEAIVTHSRHMRSEYIKHGIKPERVHEIPYYIQHKSSKSLVGPQPDACAPQEESSVSVLTPSAKEEDLPAWRLLFLGRMELLKGGLVFLDSLPQVADYLDRPLHIILAGDGNNRKSWERKAKHLESSHRKIKIEFAGWANAAQIDSLLTSCDLLVVPSLWPEPFGQVGPEAGHYGVPAAAFAVGGISSWLTNGINGHLAPGDPATSTGLAGAIIECLRDPAHYARLRQGSIELAQRFDLSEHLRALLPILKDAARRNH
jgi:glycosyltransferase involved in cell wall biosynthesis